MTGIDASIPLGARAPAIDPMQSVSALLGMQQMQQERRATALKLQAAEQKQRDDTAMRSAIQRRRLSTGGIDWDGAIEDLETSGFGNAAMELRTAAIKSRDDEAKALKSGLDATETMLQLATRVVQGIEAEAAENPTGAEDAFARGKKFLAGVTSQEIADQLGERYDPVRIKAALTWGRTAADHLTAQKNAFDQLAEIRKLEMQGQKDAPEIIEKWKQIGASTFSIAQDQDQWTKNADKLTSQGMPAGVRSLFGEEFSPQAVANATKLGMTPNERATQEGNAATRAETKRHNLKTEQQRDARLAAEDIDASAMTPEAIDTIAMQWATTGQMPAMGMGKNATKLRTNIFNRAAEMFDGLDMPAQIAAYKATTAALTDRQKQLSNLRAFEDTALKNLDVFLKQAKGVADTGSPYLNRPIRELNEKLLGSPQMAAFKAARQVVLPEFARIITNPNLTGVLSDTARGEVSGLMEKDATLGQILEVAKILQQDAGNRRTSLEAEVEALTKQASRAPRTRGTGAGGDAGLVELVDNAGKTYQVPTKDVDRALEQYKSRGLRRAK